MPQPTSQLSTTPATFDMATTELFPVNIDMTAYLQTGQSVQGSPTPMATVIDQSNNQTISAAVQGTPTINGNLVQVSLNGAALRSGGVYTLIVTFYVDATHKESTITVINVVA